MSLRSRVLQLTGLFLAKSAFRSVFAALVFLAVIFILAYLTNPSESSFRAYLTEQSFRQHLSRLDDNSEEDHGSTRDFHSRYIPPRHDNGSPFHFADRASISLRTPKHAFHSFAIFTIAAMIPPPKSDSNATDRHIYRDGSVISDAWYIGAFGKWWRGGVIEAWYQDVIARSKDEESWSSGILAVKALDKFNECNGLPFSTKNSLPYGPPRGSPPRLRNRERPSQRLAGLPSRSSTPPPLPKSASLPLHATRLPHSLPDHRQAQVDRIPSSQSLPSSLQLVSEPARLGTPVPSRSPSTLFDHSPLIADVLRQISMSTSTVHDLRQQLTDFESAAAQSHSLLQTEVDSYRDRKRQEDASRLELKSRTKTLEDSRRSAESTKVKVEKKLKVVQSARDDACQQTAHFVQQIAELHTRLADDEASAQQAKVDASMVEQEISEALEHKKQEIEATEDAVAALNAHVKELEDKLAIERERLRLARAQADARRQDQFFFPVHMPSTESSPWPSAPFDHSDSYPSSETDLSRRSSMNKKPVSPRPTKLSLGGISNFSAGSSDMNHVALRAKGYSIFDDDIASLAKSQPLANAVTTTFSPFGEPNTLAGPPAELPIRLSPSLGPAGSVSTIHHGNDNGHSRSFQSDNDPFMERDWLSASRNVHQSRLSPLTISPISDASSPIADYDPFEVRLPKHDRLHSEPVIDLQRFTMLHRTHSDPNPNANGNDGPASVSTGVMDKSTPRRWFSTSNKDKPKKGLNPDAKVFRLPKKTSTTVPVAPPTTTTGGGPGLPFDALNPNGYDCSTAAMSTASSSFLYAFKPSPAEREVLQRALGGGGSGGRGSTNASFERLPSLSDVGSIPSSPSNRPAVLAHHLLQQQQQQQQQQQSAAKEVGGKALPSWLQSLPLIRKPNFSPWDDDEPAAQQITTFMNGGGNGSM